MEMEMAMTADGAAAPTCWLRDSCRCFHGGSAVFSGVVARRGGVANKEEELVTRCKCSGGVEAAAMVVRRRERRGASRGLMRKFDIALGDQITTTLATSVLPVCSEENS
ncbi:hypothetical protein DEO72_LG9g1808 [Vigna unguiculata]|uniref:Uncharacterized protein n=1 Tax=Vigna unguiculata TaxID=3917 RepID=A0A4D6N1P4_VIGUN|nr:hypothetical protein DEO72_LG9g1808 [Vigna unguiculata]